MYFKRERRNDVRGVLVQERATNFVFYQTKKRIVYRVYIGRRVRVTFFEHAGR